MTDHRTAPASESTRCYVLDTSVLLSDPWSLTRFDEHEVVLPLVVISELEGKRHHPELGWFARTALRTIEDLFVVVATIPDLPPTRDALRALEAAASRATTFEPALGLARQLLPGRGGRGKLRFRVVSRQVGPLRARPFR